VTNAHFSGGGLFISQSPQNTHALAAEERMVHHVRCLRYRVDDTLCCERQLPGRGRSVRCLHIDGIRRPKQSHSVAFRVSWVDEALLSP
jgi:hypothetical protein